MQFHQGSRLQKLIETSGISKVDIIQKSGVTNGTLYNFFKYKEILPSKIQPILNVLKITTDEFYNPKKEVNTGNQVNEALAGYGYKEQVDGLNREIELLRKQLAAKDEIIELLKLKKR